MHWGWEWERERSTKREKERGPRRGKQTRKTAKKKEKQKQECKRKAASPMLEGWNVEQNEKCWNINKRNFVSRSISGENVACSHSHSVCVFCMCSNVRRLSPSMSKIISQAQTHREHTPTCSIVLHWLTYNSCIIYIFETWEVRELWK